MRNNILSVLTFNPVVKIFRIAAMNGYSVFGGRTETERLRVTDILTDRLRVTDWQTEWQTDWLTDREWQTESDRLRDWQTESDRLTDWQTGRLADGLKQTDWLTDSEWQTESDRLTDWQTDWQLHRLTVRELQTDRQTDWQTGRLADGLRQTDWLTDRGWQTDWQTEGDRLTDREWQTESDRLTDWQTDWLTGRQTDRKTDWLTDWQTGRRTDREWQTDWRQTDWHTGTLNCEISTVWETKPRVTPRNNSGLTSGTGTGYQNWDPASCVMMMNSNSLQCNYTDYLLQDSYTPRLVRKLISIILNFTFDFESYHVNVTEAGFLGRIVRNLQAVVPYHVTNGLSENCQP